MYVGGRFLNENSTFPNISLYEVEISYKIEDYFYTLRKEWEESIKEEKLEDRNWRLLKELEKLMDKVNEYNL